MPPARTEKGVKKDADPLMPILPDRLRAAMQLGQWTSATLAVEMDRASKRPLGTENRQTIHALAQASALTRCRASRRKLLARVLQVPEQWLAGETVTTGRPGELAMHHITASSPRATLAGLRLHVQLIRACARDIDTYRPVETDADPARAREDVLQQFSWCLGQLLSARRWRFALLQEQAPRSVLAELTELLAPSPPTEREEEENAVLGLIAALKFALWPWYKGKRDLNYGRLHALAIATSHRGEPILLSGPPPQRIVRKDGRVFAPDDPRTPFALLGWATAQNNDAFTTKKRKNS